jgi:membrane-bound lytic murein transglycosylase A
MLRIAKILSQFLLLLTLMCFTGCYPALIKPAQRPDEALSRVRFFYPTFRDDMHIDSLVLALERNLEYLHRLDPEKVFYYGPDKFTCRQVLESQETLLKLIKENPDSDKLDKEVRKQFRIYRATGRMGNSKVLFTGYFEPIFDGSLTPDETFKYPIYRQPDDLVKIDLSLFSNKLKGQSIVARIEGNKVIPYYSRRNIEMEKALHGRNLEIAWLKDPVDVAFLQIQGSGRLRLPDGNTVSVGYKASNGHPYRSIGRYMLDMGFMKREQMSMQGIRAYLAEHPDIINEVLDHNPSYVFFHVLDNGPLGSINVPVTPGRSLALDPGLFPKGALAFMKCRKPVVNNRGEITKWKEFSRFVLNQDTGGAIKGAGRADLFWGSGPYAETAAGHMQHDGMLYILIKKPK